MSEDERFMHEAIELSKKAVEHGNEPFGAVLVKDGKIVFSNENQIYTKHDYTYHAEAGLIRDFAAATGICDLSDYTLYSSAEPCFMCSGAMVFSRLGRLVFAVSDKELCEAAGESGNETSSIVFSLSSHHPTVTSGVLRDESLAVLKEYFKNREKN